MNSEPDQYRYLPGEKPVRDGIALHPADFIGTQILIVPTFEIIRLVHYS